MNTVPPNASLYASAAPALIGESRVILALREEIVAAARTHAKVLIIGETGAGKEVAARLLHAHSARARRPFVAVNCGGIPDSLLESELFGHVRGSFTGADRDAPGLVRQADGGTLFLDELGEMSLRMQAVLLRFTETGEIQPVGGRGAAARADVRLVCATNRDLRRQVAAGAFREDLYFRLNVIQIRVPPLRERGTDVLLLLDYYLEALAHVYRMRPPALSPDAAQLLLAYAWPGNVRELRNVAERLVLRDPSRPIEPDDLPVEIRAGAIEAEAPQLDTCAPPAGAGITAAFVSTPIVDALWERMRQGEDFWTVVARPFKARELRRADLRALIDRGLRETRGSYRALLHAFNLPPSDYKRFHAFLYQQQCNLPVTLYRNDCKFIPPRREPRMPVAVDVPVVVDDTPGRLLDISASGARLAVQRRGGAGIRGPLTLNFPTQQATVRVELAWKRRQGHALWACGVSVTPDFGAQWDAVLASTRRLLEDPTARAS
ncbi:MAG TPA: sigma-54 dependent transcriptional regulator [Vicinamibacterales bacterium]|nr:sigma-54 dependent transcriptional regulator [Vicinamibacterales bacterium]